MDREIPKEVRNKQRKKQIIKYSSILIAAAVCIVALISLMRSSVPRKDLLFSEAGKGTIEVSISASGKVVPAFEEIINSPINTRIIEVIRMIAHEVNNTVAGITSTLDTVDDTLK